MAKIMNRQGRGSEKRGYQPQDSGSKRVPYGIPDGYRPKAGGAGDIVPPPAGAIAGDVPAEHVKPSGRPSGGASEERVNNE